MTPTTTPADSQPFTAATRRFTAATQSTTARTQSTTTRTTTSVKSSSIETTTLSTLESSTSMMSSDTIAMISTKPTVMPTTPMPVVIAVSSGAAGGAVVVLAGVVIVLCQRNKQKRLRVRTNDTIAGDDTESGTVADVRTKPEVEYAVVRKIKTKQPSQVHDCNTESGYHYASVDDGARPMKQGVNDQTYDTATITEKKQPITFDNTYARAIFSQSGADTGDDVYDHTRVTGKASQEVDASHYDHAFFK
ncbi:uncharacterized protein LOC124116491 [Haliotis rufescens]|uniref:uncharacterized protein LOC124116491 n=1 Tax=Haliotis rufescens TaxID=6454 RepID=UPI00201F14D8|nr:uncharacterized protein LOC124116491 [Haliotis rufescens]